MSQYFIIHIIVKRVFSCTTSSVLPIDLSVTAISSSIHFTAYKKHYPPASDDEVWRLDNIAKDGSSHKRLIEAGIFNVEEFSRQLSTDPKKLRNILGKCMTEKKWKVLLDHANTCVLNGKLYVYFHDNESDCGVIFNNVGQLSGLIADGLYCATHRFSLQQKVYADGLVKKACENWNDVREFNAEASSSSMSEKISRPFLSEVLGDQQCCHPVHDNMPPPRLASQVGLKVPPRSSASTVEGNSGITAAGLQIQSQILNSQNATWNQTIDRFNQMEPSADTNVQPSGSFPAFENSGITAAGLQIQSQSLNSQNATWNQTIDRCNQMEPLADTDVQPSGSFPALENSGITAAGLQIQSQSLNFQNATWNQTIDRFNQMEPSADTNVWPSGSFPAFENSGITAAGLQIQSQSLNSQNATWNQTIDRFNQMEPSADTNVQPFGQLDG